MSGSWGGSGWARGGYSNINRSTGKINGTDHPYETTGKRGFIKGEKNPIKSDVYVDKVWKIVIFDILRYIPISVLAFALLLLFLFIGVGDQVIGIFTGEQTFNLMFLSNISLLMFLSFATFWFPFVILRKYIRQKKANERIIAQKNRQKKWDKDSGKYTYK